MRYLVTFFWSFVLCQMVAFVAGSISGATLDPKLATVVSFVFAIGVFLLGDFAMGDDKKTAHAHH
ncbi:MAG: YjzD family protein [Bacilli bacterium]